MPEIVEQAPKSEVPEDVATLYAWANLQGAPYQDFSAARRVYRAQVRVRAAETGRHVPPRAEFAAPGQGAVLREAAGVDRTRLALEAAAARLRQAGLPGTTASRADEMPAKSLETVAESMRPQRFPQRRSAREMMPRAEVGTEIREQVGAAGDSPAFGDLLLERAAAAAESPVPRTIAPVRTLGPGVPEAEGALAARVSGSTDATVAEALGKGASAGGVTGPALVAGAASPKVAGGASPTAQEGESPIPAWLHGSGREEGTAPTETPARGSSLGGETLQHTRERVASRWYALRGVFDPAAPEMEPTQAYARANGGAVLVVFSPAGGVGKTSLTASLGRALSADGERVLLVDAGTQGLLPFYFGAQESRAGVLRRFLPAAGSIGAPISLLRHDLVGQPEAERAGGGALATEIARYSREFERVLVDLSAGVPGALRGFLGRGATVLVPIAPDMNSVITLRSVETFFAGFSDPAGRPVQPRYLMTQFDPALPLHLDVREVIRQQLGDRLLPFAIRRSPAVAEALAEGMTVVDYEPEGGVTADFRDVANWARGLTATSAGTPRPGRWSER